MLQSVRKYKVCKAYHKGLRVQRGMFYATIKRTGRVRRLHFAEKKKINKQPQMIEITQYQTDLSLYLVIFFAYMQAVCFFYHNTIIGGNVLWQFIMK